VVKRWKICIYIGFLVGALLGEAGLSKNASEGVLLPEVKVGEEEPLWDWERGEGPQETVGTFEVGPHPVVDLLQSSPSIQVAPTGTLGDPPSYSVRGFESSQARVFLEEIPLTESAFQSNSLLFLPSLAVESLEVFPTAVPVSFLSAGIGSAVNFNLQSLKPKNTFLVEGGDLGFFKAAASAPLFAGAKMYLDYVQSNEDFTYWDNNGTPFNSADDQLKTRENNHFRRLSLMPFWNFSLPRGFEAKAFSLAGFQNKTTPGSTETPEAHQLREWVNVSALKLRGPLSDQWISESTFYVRWKKEDLTSLAIDSGSSSKNTTLGGKVSFLFKEFSWNSRFSLGLQSEEFFVKADSRNRGVESVQWEAPFSLATQWDVNPKLSLYPSFLGLLHNANGDFQGDWEMNSSSRFGMEYRFNRSLAVQGFLARVFRKPSLSERYGFQTNIEGNSELLDETAWKAELGWKWKPANHLQLSQTVFGAQARNLIALVPKSSNTYQAENISAARWMGQEIALRFYQETGWSFRPALVSMITQNNSDIASESGKLLPHRSPLSFQGITSWDSGRWFVSHRIQYLSAAFVDRANLKEREAYQLHDLSMGFVDKEWGKFEVKLLNLFNVTLASVAEGGVEVNQYLNGDSNYPSTGRRVSFSWIYDL